MEKFSWLAVTSASMAALSHGQFSVASFQSSRFLMCDSLLSSNIFEGFIVPFFLHVSVLSHYLDHGA
jgi:hypothetical protein